MKRKMAWIVFGVIVGVLCGIGLYRIGFQEDTSQPVVEEPVEYTSTYYWILDNYTLHD